MNSPQEQAAGQSGYGQMGYASQGSVPKTAKDHNPDCFTARLTQLIYGLNTALHCVGRIEERFFGAKPSSIEAGMNQSVDPPVTTQLEMLQAKVTELNQKLENLAGAV